MANTLFFHANALKRPCLALMTIRTGVAFLRHGSTPVLSEGSGDFRWDEVVSPNSREGPPYFAILAGKSLDGRLFPFSAASYISVGPTSKSDIPGICGYALNAATADIAS